MTGTKFLDHHYCLWGFTLGNYNWDWSCHSNPATLVWAADVTSKVFSHRCNQCLPQIKKKSFCFGNWWYRSVTLIRVETEYNPASISSQYKICEFYWIHGFSILCIIVEFNMYIFGVCIYIYIISLSVIFCETNLTFAALAAQKLKEHMLYHMLHTDPSVDFSRRAQGFRNVCTILFFLIVRHSTVHFKICDKLKDPRIEVRFNKQLPIWANERFYL